MSAQPLNNGFNVVGVVVYAVPARLDAVQADLAALPGVEVHAHAEDGRIIVTAADTQNAMAIEQLAAMNRMAGVVCASIAYHQVDDPDPGLAAHRAAQLPPEG